MHSRSLIPPETMGGCQLMPAVVMTIATADGQPRAESDTADHHGDQHRARDPQRA
ncbi:hypothetical protein ACIBCN_00725 [Nocardia sp. NPDC051052]|uniref:hypothetical protein n=1 Tax=Nocardia sp. NPDC051052 TaxID=3364322 RepID=UPI00378956F9